MKNRDLLFSPKLTKLTCGVTNKDFVGTMIWFSTNNDFTKKIYLVKNKDKYCVHFNSGILARNYLYTDESKAFNDFLYLERRMKLLDKPVDKKVRFN